MRRVRVDGERLAEDARARGGLGPEADALAALHALRVAEAQADGRDREEREAEEDAARELREGRPSGRLGRQVPGRRVRGTRRAAPR